MKMNSYLQNIVKEETEMIIFEKQIIQESFTGIFKDIWDSVGQGLSDFSDWYIAPKGDYNLIVTAARGQKLDRFETFVLKVSDYKPGLKKFESGRLTLKKKLYSDIQKNIANTSKKIVNIYRKFKDSQRKREVLSIIEDFLDSSKSILDDNAVIETNYILGRDTEALNEKMFLDQNIESFYEQNIQNIDFSKRDYKKQLARSLEKGFVKLLNVPAAHRGAKPEGFDNWPFENLNDLTLYLDYYTKNRPGGKLGKVMQAYSDLAELKRIATNAQDFVLGASVFVAGFFIPMPLFAGPGIKLFLARFTASVIVGAAMTETAIKLYQSMVDEFNSLLHNIQETKILLENYKNSCEQSDESGEITFTCDQNIKTKITRKLEIMSRQQKMLFQELKKKQKTELTQDVKGFDFPATFEEEVNNPETADQYIKYLTNVEQFLVQYIATLEGARSGGLDRIRRKYLDIDQKSLPPLEPPPAPVGPASPVPLGASQPVHPTAVDGTSAPPETGELPSPAADEEPEEELVVEKANNFQEVRTILKSLGQSTRKIYKRNDEIFAVKNISPNKISSQWRLQAEDAIQRTQVSNRDNWRKVWLEMRKTDPQKAGELMAFYHRPVYGVSLDWFGPGERKVILGFEPNIPDRVAVSLNNKSELIYKNNFDKNILNEVVKRIKFYNEQMKSLVLSLQEINNDPALKKPATRRTLSFVEAARDISETALEAIQDEKQSAISRAWKVFLLSRIWNEGN